jgi:hypothetical protein
VLNPALDHDATKRVELSAARSDGLDLFARRVEIAWQADGLELTGLPRRAAEVQAMKRKRPHLVMDLVMNAPSGAARADTSWTTGAT